MAGLPVFPDSSPALPVPAVPCGGVANSVDASLAGTGGVSGVALDASLAPVLPTASGG